jgi:hypothetical protein
MATRKIYSASLERLPDTYAELEAYRRNPAKEGLTDRLPGENPDWLMRSRAGGKYTDYDFGAMYRFSEEGTLPGGDSENYGPGDAPNPLNILREAVYNNQEGKRRFRLTLEEEE